MVGESELLKLKGKYIRIAHKDLGSTIEIIGNIIKDKWFDDSGQVYVVIAWRPLPDLYKKIQEENK